MFISIVFLLLTTPHTAPVARVSVLVPECSLCSRLANFSFHSTTAGQVQSFAREGKVLLLLLCDN